MKAKELIDLADYLETVPEEGFNMRYWHDKALAREANCGFAGCAIGWASHGKVVPGLTLDRGGDPEFVNEHGDVFAGFTAIARAFDIDYYGAKALFNGHVVATAKEEAQRIRNYVAAHCPNKESAT